MANLHRLSSYTSFDYDGFINDGNKKTILNSIKYDAGLLKGELVIIADATNENLYGKIGFKIPAKSETDVGKFKLREFYHLEGVEKAVIYGDFRDLLSVTAGALVYDAKPKD